MGVEKLKYDYPAYFAFEFDGKIMKHFMLAPTLGEIESDLKDRPENGDEEKVLVTGVENVPEKSLSKFFEDIKSFVEGMNSVYHVIYITSAIGTGIVNSYAKNNMWSLSRKIAIIFMIEKVLRSMVFRITLCMILIERLRNSKILM